MRMLCNDVEPPVAETVLLAAVRGQPVSPSVAAAGLAAEEELVSPGEEAVAHVVVVAVAERLVEQADFEQGGAAVSGVAGADMVRAVGEQSAVALLEVQRHYSRRQRIARIAGVVALDRPHRGICHVLQQP